MGKEKTSSKIMLYLRLSLCFLSVLSLILSIGRLFILYFQHYWNGSFYYADNLYCAAFYKSLFIDGFSYRSMYLQPNPAFFPDLFLWGILQSILQNVYFVFPFFFCSVILITFIFTFLINKSFYSTIQSLIFSCFSIVILCYLTTFLQLDREIYQLILLPGAHFGVMIFGLLSLYLIIKVIKDDFSAKKAYSYGFVLFIVIVLATVSDRNFIIQFSGPLIVGIAFLAISKYFDKKIIFLFSIVIFSSLIGYFLSDCTLIVPDMPGSNSSISLTKAFNSFKGLMLLFYECNTIFYIVIFYLFALILFARKVFLRKKENYINNNSVAVFLYVVILSQVILIITLTLLIGHFTLTPRYYSPIFFIPILFGPIILFKKSNVFYEVLIVLVSFVLVFSYFNKMYNKKFYKEYYPEHVREFDELAEKYDLKYGIGPYWPTNPLMLLSKSKILVAMYDFDLHPQPIFTSSGYYRDKYDFAISGNKVYTSNNLDFEKIIAKNGIPEKSVKLEGSRAISILIYPKNKLIIPK